MKTRETLPEKMAAVLLTGHGGFDRLEYREDVPVPLPGSDEVLIRVAAAAVNNTDINTRIGWYSKSVSSGTNDGADHGVSPAVDDDGGWSGKGMAFPLIQGADVCGYIVGAGDQVDPARIGERVIVRNLMRAPCDFRPFECWTFGSECDGGFAQYTKAPSVEVYKVETDLTDAELSAVSCAGSTAENLLYRSGVTSGDRVLITGASGGVGSAVVQLAGIRGAEVMAVAAASKADAVKALGADQVILRDADPADIFGHESLDVVIDLVGGEKWAGLLDLLKRGGRYAVAGAIAGPMVQLDLRTLYLKDLTFFGCTFQTDEVFENLIGYIEQGLFKPVVAKTYPLKEIVKAQQEFINKTCFGKLVLIPPAER